jgi:NAD(P)-dependent dehydrogenase (short-subunit alcohol dehydrogenase family)
MEQGSTHAAGHSAPSVRSDAPVVVVTGASAGVGRATATAFGRRGYRVALLARGHAGMAGARRDVEAAGGQALAIPTDTADPEAVFAAADQVAAAWGRLDVWVNDAMATVFGPAERVTPAEWERVTRTDYLGYVHGTLAALKHMRPRDAGTIVQVGSALAYRSIPLQAPYCAAKFAIRGFTDALRAELSHDRSRVRLTMVQLPGVNTPQFAWSATHMPRRHRPVGAWYRPEAVAEQILRAADAAPRELWVGWPAIEAILGSMAIPGLLDRYLSASAYEQQMSDAPAPPAGDEGILFAPAGTDHGAQGPFGAGARAAAVGLDPALLRGGLAAAALGALAAAFWAGRRSAEARQAPRR